MSMRKSLGLWCVAGLVCWGGCVSAMPSFAGGRTTPRGRGDMLAGGSAYVPLGDLRAHAGAVSLSDTGLRFAQPGGVVPVAAVRYGIDRNVDIDLMAAGASARSQLRYGWWLRQAKELDAPNIQLAVGIAPDAGYFQDADNHVLRLGAELPLTVLVDFASVYEFWLGARVGATHLNGQLLLSSAMNHVSMDAWGWRVGGVVGTALGFGRVHVLIEINAYHERWRVAVDASNVGISGISLVPAFGFRIRL